MEKDLYQHPDYYQLDEFLTDEHKLIRDSVRAYVKKEISPIIEEYAQNAAFPEQIIIPPEQKRSVKVTWMGKSEELKSENAYRFVAEQLPLTLNKEKKTKTGIKMLLKFVAALYVAPADSEAKISCEFLGENLTCENSGNRHQIILFKNLILEDGKQKVEFKKEDLKKINGENILAAGKRIFKLPNSEKLKQLKQPVKVNFKLE